MKLNGPKTIIQTNTGNTQNSTPNSWTVGQRLNATVTSKSTHGNITLNIAGAAYSTTTSAPLKVGQQLQLSVLNLADLPTAKALNMPTNVSTATHSASNSATAQSTGAPLISLDIPDSLRASLAKGDIISVRVAQTLSPSQVLLNLSNQQITAHTTTALNPGKSLTLQLVTLGGPPKLLILTPIESLQGGATYLRENIAIQQSYAPLLANMLYLSMQNNSTISQNHSAPNSSVASQLRHIARQILNNLSTPRSLSSASGLKQGLQQSGIFFESLLKTLALGSIAENQVNTVVKSDLKANLLHLLHYISQQRTTPPTTSLVNNRPQPAPPLRHSRPVAQGATQANITPQSSLTTVLDELFQQVKGSLARTVLSQLASGERSDDGKRVMTTEIPVLQNDAIDIIQFRIEQEASPASSQQPPSAWSVIIAFEIGMMGPVHAKILLHHHKIHINFWSERRFTQTFIAQHLTILRDNIAKAGIQVAQLNSYEGKPPAPTTDDSPQNIMLDINV